MSERQRRRRLRRRRQAGQRTRSRARIAAGAGITAGAVFAVSGNAQAAVDTITVDSLTDDGTGGTTLREAITLLDDGDTSNDKIVFQADLTGTIHLNSILPTIDEPLYIDGRDPGAVDPITVSGDPDTDPYNSNSSKIFNIQSTDGDDVKIEGLTLSDGAATGSGPAGGGAAIFSIGADLTVQNATITGNSANLRGGGIQSGPMGPGGPGTLTLDQSTVSNNYAGFYSSGGGPGGGGVDANGNSAVIRDSLITGNSAMGGGGGLRLQADTATVERSTISNNSNDGGGGGGGISVGGGGTFGTPAVTIDQSTISGNNAPSGGGGINSEGGYGTYPSITVKNSTISGNQALGGAGIRTYNTYLTVKHSTIASNSFGGITSIPEYVVSDPHVTSTVIADNSAGPLEKFQDFYAQYGHLYAGFSLIESPGSTTIHSAGPNIIGKDPQLGGLASNGGLTQTMKPASTSPVVDQGNGGVAATDQRGGAFNRVFDVPTLANAAGGDGADIGAFELQSSEYVAPPVPPVTPVTPATPSTTTSSFDLDAAIKKCKKKFKKGSSKRKKCIKKAKQRA